MRKLLKGGLRKLAGRPNGAPRRALGHRRATVIAVSTLKGGVGKTTTSVNLGAALARFEGKRVLLVDLDPQGHVSTAMKQQLRQGGGRLSSVLDNDTGTEVMDIAAHTSVEGLHLTPLDPTLARSEDLLGTRIGKELILRDALRATRTHYDAIIVDCPPNLGNLTINGLVACDQVLIPCDPSPLAVTGVHKLVEAITTVASRLNPDIDVLGVLLTRVDGRNKRLNEQVLEQIREQYGTVLLPTRVGTSTALARAQVAGQDVFAYDDTSRAADQYRALARYIASEAL